MDSASQHRALPRGGDETILLVEDDEPVREMGESQLVSFGYQVVSAANGVDALSRHADNPNVRILVTDVVMPDMGGRELARRLRALRPQLKVLFTSGYTSMPSSTPTSSTRARVSCRSPTPHRNSPR